MRSCWECNGAHEHLKKVNSLHMCFECGRYWMFDRFFESFPTEESMVKWIDEIGLKVGMSSTEIDGGYRVMVLTIGKDAKP